MLTNTTVRCSYCKRQAYFYVHAWKGTAYAAIYTECPKCHKYVDVYYFTLDLYDRYLKDVLAGKENPGSPKRGV